MSQESRSKTKSEAMADLVSSMKQQLDYYWSLGEATDKGLNHSLIYKVQQHIREVDVYSYEPFILSIGPYHHGSAKLWNMEKWKWGYLDAVLKLNPTKTLLDYLLVIKELTQEARNCYSDNIDMNDEDFLQMLLLDGCFILVGLGGAESISAHLKQVESARSALEEIAVEIGNGQLGSEANDHMQSNTACQGDQSGRKANNSGENDEQGGLWTMGFLYHDLFLLENQIPFFVVKKLYELASGNVSLSPSLTDKLNKYVQHALSFYPKVIRGPSRPEDFEHLLHLCHMYLRPNQNADSNHHFHVESMYCTFFSLGRRYFRLGHHPEGNERIQSVVQEEHYLQVGLELNRWRRTAQYIDAGVKFKKREYDSMNPHSLLDIKFSNGCIEIPCLVVDEYSGGFFRNVIAFEQTCPQFGDDFTAYIIFMSQIISMTEDVSLLVEREIIVHHLDSDGHVSDLFTMLSKDVVFDFNGQYYLKSLCQAMEEHYQNRLNRWIAWLWLNHLSNPWLALAAFGTVVVLVCTIIQTIFTMLAYMKPPTHQ